MKTIIFQAVLWSFLTMNSYGQDKRASFWNLSSPEKWWVIWHPFKAKNALEASLQTLRVTDSILNLGVVGTDISGGRLDAFKHAYWMALLSRRIGEKAAVKKAVKAVGKFVRQSGGRGQYGHVKIDLEPGLTFIEKTRRQMKSLWQHWSLSHCCPGS